MLVKYLATFCGEKLKKIKTDKDNMCIATIRVLRFYLVQYQTREPTHPPTPGLLAESMIWRDRNLKFGSQIYDLEVT